MELKGKLEFISIFKPIRLISEDSEIDLRKYYFDLFEKLNGKKSKMNYHMNDIEICSDDNSEYVIKYENDNNGILIILDKINEFGFSNIKAYLSDMLQRLNGRCVIVTASENSIKIISDPSEEVFGLYYTNSNNCKIPDDKIKSLCKIGEEDCCIFCCVGSNGFECLKFNSPSARMLLGRYSRNDINATKIGNCAILGRKR